MKRYEPPILGKAERIDSGAWVFALVAIVLAVFVFAPLIVGMM
jgi:hypothetical protein